MKKILSGLLVLVGFLMFVSPSYAAQATDSRKSIVYVVPLWQHTTGTTNGIVSIFSVTSRGNTAVNKAFASTASTVEIRLYNNALAGSTNNWTSATVSVGNLWGSIERSFTSGNYQNLMADTSNTGTGKWITSTGWSSSSTNDLGYATVEIYSTTTTPAAADFDVQAWIYNGANGARAGFPVTVGTATTVTGNVTNY